MSVNDAILATQPTSYWPLDDLSGSSSCHDEMGLHDASLPSAGVTLSVLPFGTSQAPFFDGALKSVLTIPDDPQYSQPFAKALTVSAWLCPLALNNANVVGGQDRYVHYVEKAVAESVDVEWALRFTISKIKPAIRVSRSTRSTSVRRPARAMAPTWNMASRRTMRRRSSWGNGCSWLARPSVGFRRAIFQWAARSGNKVLPRRRELADKYGEYGVEPQHGSGSITVGGRRKPAS